VYNSQNEEDRKSLEVKHANDKEKAQRKLIQRWIDEKDPKKKERLQNEINIDFRKEVGAQLKERQDLGLSILKRDAVRRIFMDDYFSENKHLRNVLDPFDPPPSKRKTIERIKAVIGTIIENQQEDGWVSRSVINKAISGSPLFPDPTTFQRTLGLLSDAKVIEGDLRLVPRRRRLKEEKKKKTRFYRLDPSLLSEGFDALSRREKAFFLTDQFAQIFRELAEEKYVELGIRSDRVVSDMIERLRERWPIMNITDEEIARTLEVVSAVEIKDMDEGWVTNMKVKLAKQKAERKASINVD